MSNRQSVKDLCVQSFGKGWSQGMAVLVALTCPVSLVVGVSRAVAGESLDREPSSGAPSFDSAGESREPEAGPRALRSADSDRPRVAIQRRKYQMAHEFSLAAGVMPLDAFQKGLTGTFRYTVHFEGYFAWEAVAATVAHLTSTALREELIDTFAIPVEDFAAPRLMLTTGFEFSPVYGKQAFLNDTIVHQGFFVGVHGGAIFGDRPTLDETFSDLRPTVGLGLGYRMFVTKALSFRIDIRDFLSLKDAKRMNEAVEVENVLLITGSLGVNVWRDDA